MLYSFKLQTVIKTDGIYVRFFPIHIAFRKYSWDKLSKVYVRTYSPLAEYGGWGLRLGLFGKGMRSMFQEPTDCNWNLQTAAVDRDV